LIVTLLGGFTTNALWCLTLSVRNKTGRDYLRVQNPKPVPARGEAEGLSPADAAALADQRPASPTAPSTSAVPDPAPSLFSNYLFSALAGITWYFQFFFYGMGTTKMGKYDFSSWTIHMAFIITFSSLWGIFFHEWKGTSRPTRRLVVGGILVLILSTIVVGIGNYVATLK
jgi:L-rhamnose-H+ transport protein